MSADTASSFIGAEVREALPTGTERGCNYGNPNYDETTLLIHIDEGDDPSKFAADRGFANQPQALALGDEAFAVSNAETGVHAADARVADTRYRVVIGGPRATAEGTANALRHIVEKGRSN